MSHHEVKALKKELIENVGNNDLYIFFLKFWKALYISLASHPFLHCS